MEPNSKFGEAAQEGLDVVIVNPGIILGPGFWRSGGSGSLFKQIYKGPNLLYQMVATGYIDVLDVVSDIMIQLMESDTKNESVLFW